VNDTYGYAQDSLAVLTLRDTAFHCLECAFVHESHLHAENDLAYFDSELGVQYKSRDLDGVVLIQYESTPELLGYFDTKVFRRQGYIVIEDEF
jgi:hypothetical protein